MAYSLTHSMTTHAMKPTTDALYALMNMPWTIESGVKEDGTRWARCKEIPHAVAYADVGEDLERLFWDSMRASLEAMISTGEHVPLPAGVVNIRSASASMPVSVRQVPSRWFHLGRHRLEVQKSTDAQSISASPSTEVPELAMVG